MHRSAHAHMQNCVAEYFSAEKHKTVLDLGSRAVSGATLTHKALFDGLDINYVGVDIVEGPNVDIVMEAPYRIPMDDDSADIIVSGQVFEHVPFFWVTFLEMARVLRRGGYIFLTAPSRGHVHSPPTDCWRYYPDGMLALGVFAGLKVVKATTDFPPRTADGKRFDYGAISGYRYWGDTLGVFQKEDSYDLDRKIKPVREAMIKWANNRPDLKPGVAPQTNDGVARFIADMQAAERGGSQVVISAEDLAAKAAAAANVEYIKYANGSLNVAVREGVVSPVIRRKIENGRYEQVEADTVKRILQPDEVLMELGSGVGVISSIAHSTGLVKEVHCFEADPRLISLIKATHAKNGIKNSNVYNQVLSSNKQDIKRGTITFNIRGDFYGSSVNKDIGREVAYSVDIPSRSMADAVSAIKPTVIVCDIEGAELGLFAGVNLDSVHRLMIETHQVALGGGGMRQLFEEMHRAGFHYDQEFSNGSVPVFSRVS